MIPSHPMVRRTFLRLGAVSAAVAAAACASVERLALPEPTPLGPVWSRFAPTAEVAIDHAAWDAFLARHVAPDAEGVHRVSYAAVSAGERAALQGYIDTLQTTDATRLTRDQALAFWINLYNAVTVAVVLDAYPVESIRDIAEGALSFGPWDMKRVTVMGAPLSLNDIEHRIIRPVFQEPRIHYAVNCAAVGCPNLALTAWRASDLEARFAAAERAYVNDPRGVRFDAQDRLIVSKIYAWFREDFGPNEAAVIASLATAAATPLRARLEGRTRIDRYEYDWSLNER